MGTLLTNEISGATMGAREQERVAWVDVAKAASILLVVLFHAYDGEYRWLRWASPMPFASWWQIFNEGLKSARMPLFFLASGLLAGPSLGRAWAAIAHKRVYNPAYLYLLWAVILSLFFSVLRLATGIADEPLGEKLVLLVLGVSWAWYLGALPAFFILARLTRNWPAWMPVGLAFALGMFADIDPFSLPWSTNSMMRSLAFFLAGARLPDLARGVAEKPILHLLIAAPPLAGASLFLGPVAGAGPIISLFAIWFSIALASIAGRNPHVRACGEWLGARTLPIYILHFPVLALLGLSFRQMLTRPMLESNMIAALLPIALTLAAVPLSLALHRLIVSLGGAWLFALPRLPERRSTLATA